MRRLLLAAAMMILLASCTLSSEEVSISSQPDVPQTSLPTDASSPRRPPSVAADPSVHQTTGATTTTTTGATTTTTGATTTTTTSAPPGSPTDRTIYPGEDIQRAVDANAAGSTFTIKSGVHRMQQVWPKDGDTFVGESGAVLNGSRLLTSFTREGSFWVVSGQTQGTGGLSQGEEYGYCYSGTACIYPEDVFMDNRLLRQVLSKSALSSGEFYFDYANDKIYLADDPAGKTIETSVSTYAFYGSSDNVTIKSLTIEKYATPARRGVINPRPGRTGPQGNNWLVQNNVIRYIHGVSVKAVGGMRVIGNKILYSGQIGISASGPGLLIENNEIAGNCTVGYKCLGWEGGATKFSSTTDLVVRGNYVHDNQGHGLHTDANNVNTLYENNTVRNNWGSGIEHEISGSAVIRNNTVTGNGFSPYGGRYGIAAINSTGVEIYGNQVIDNAWGIIGRDDGRGSYELRDFWVHDNYIEGIGAIGVIQTTGSDAVFTSNNNRFDSNTYKLPDGYHYYKWMGTRGPNRTIEEWINYGNDTHGTWQ